MCGPQHSQKRPLAGKLRAGHARPLLRNYSKPTLYLLPKPTKRGTLNYITLGVSDMEITENSKTLKFDANGLIPAIVQDLSLIHI